MSYASLLREIDPSRDPRHLEAWLRSEHGTLDHLSRDAIIREVRDLGPMIDADPEFAEQLAQSFGLVQR